MATVGLSAVPGARELSALRLLGSEQALGRRKARWRRRRLPGGQARQQAGEKPLRVWCP